MLTNLVVPQDYIGAVDVVAVGGGVRARHHQVRLRPPMLRLPLLPLAVLDGLGGAYDGGARRDGRDNP